jgi:sugar phosphate isomerase/epimerase
VAGLGGVILNHPQHTTDAGLAPPAVAAALRSAGLAAAGIATRFPDTLREGAFSNPDATLRAAALAIGVDSCRWAEALGAPEVIVWSPYDGFDYNFQADFDVAWRRIADAFRSLADACAPRVRVSLEWKPTDAASRFSFVPSTGAALLLAAQVNRANFGLTLDVGHLLMAGENPAQSAAAVASAGALFGVQLGDAHVRPGAEDGLAFGSVHAAAAAELVYWLRQRIRYNRTVYFDTFPVNEDPEREAALNIRRFKALWARAGRLAAAGMDALLARHDAMGALEALEADGGAW